MQAPSLKRPKTEDPLHTEGYKVFRGAIEIPDRVQECIERVAQQNGRPIFNFNDSTKSRDDRKRLQCRIPNRSKYMRSFIRGLERFIEVEISKNLKARDWMIIHSRPGCQDQAAHCDYLPETLEGTPDRQISLAMLICTMPETKLNIWPGSIKLANMSEEELKKIPPIACREVKLNTGDVLLFRADFIHAGSGYQNNNYRIHAFLDSDKVQRPPNVTWTVHRDGNQELIRIIQ